MPIEDILIYCMVCGGSLILFFVTLHKAVEEFLLQDLNKFNSSQYAFSILIATLVLTDIICLLYQAVIMKNNDVMAWLAWILLAEVFFDFLIAGYVTILLSVAKISFAFLKRYMIFYSLLFALYNVAHGIFITKSLYFILVALLVIHTIFCFVFRKKGACS